MSSVERYGTFFVFLLSTAALSRLLTAEEFGVYAILGSLIAVTAAAFQEFGGANFLIQKDLLTETSIRTAFTTTFCMSLGVAVVLFAMRGPAARFFGVPGLSIGISVYVLNLLLSPFATTISALLRREMKFGTLARANFAASSIVAGVSVTLGLLGFGFMAPVWGSVVGNSALLVFMLAARPDVRIFRPCLRQSGDVFGFGAYSSMVAVFNVFYQTAPQMIIARVIDLSAVGLYSRAVNATQIIDRLVIQAVSPVIMPAIFEQIRIGKSLKQIYLRSLGILTIVQWPFLIYLAFMAEPIVVIWLGGQWVGIVPLTRLLCVASLSLAAACLTYPVLVAAGRVRDTLTMSFVSVPPSLLVTLVASFFGVGAVAASTLITFPFQALVAFYFICRQLDISPADIVRSTYKSAIVAACTAGGILVCLQGYRSWPAIPLAALVVGSLGALIGWCAGAAFTRHPVLGEIRLVVGGIGAFRRTMLRRRQTTPMAAEPSQF